MKEQKQSFRGPKSLLNQVNQKVELIYFIIASIVIFGSFPYTKYIYEERFDKFEINFPNTVNPFWTLWQKWWLVGIFAGFTIIVWRSSKVFTGKYKIYPTIFYILLEGNIIDRAYFNIDQFNANDYITIILAILIALYNYHKECQTKTWKYSKELLLSKKIPFRKY